MAIVGQWRLSAQFEIYLLVDPQFDSPMPKNGRTIKTSSASSDIGAGGRVVLPPMREGSHQMPGDPKECRRHAERCRKLAVAADTQQLKATYLSLSKDWEILAIQLEDAFAKLVENESVRSNVRESLNENKRLSDLPIWEKIVRYEISRRLG